MCSKYFFLVILLCLIFNGHGEAATFYVAAEGGSDSNPCIANDPTKTKRTIDAGIGCLKGGDRLEIKVGSYSAPTAKVPSGTSWTSATTITHYQNDVVTVTPAGGTCFLYGPCAIQRYVIVDGLVWDGIGLGTEGQDHVRIINNEIKNAPTQGIEAYQGSFNEYINNKVHHNGHEPNHDHGIYMSGNNHLIEGNNFYSNCSAGIQLYADGTATINDNVIRNNWVHDNDTCGYNTPAIIIYEGARNAVYNNIVNRNPQGITTGGGATNTKIYNNTIVDNTYNGLYLYNASGTQVKNNIIYGNRGGEITDATGASLDHNLTTDPKFINSASLDFHLQSTSPAINSGVTLSEVASDFEGTPRPQGGAYDIGAYEFKSGSVAARPQAPSNFRVQ